MQKLLKRVNCNKTISLFLISSDKEFLEFNKDDIVAVNINQHASDVCACRTDHNLNLSSLQSFLMYS